MTIATSRGDSIRGALEDAAGSADSSSYPSDNDGCGAGVNTNMTKATAAAAEKDKIKSPVLAHITEANVQALILQYQPKPGGGGKTE